MKERPLEAINHDRTFSQRITDRAGKNTRFAVIAGLSGIIGTGLLNLLLRNNNDAKVSPLVPTRTPLPTYTPTHELPKTPTATVNRAPSVTVAQRPTVPTPPVENKEPDPRFARPGNPHIGLGNGVWLENDWKGYVSRVHIPTAAILDGNSRIDFKKVKKYDFEGSKEKIRENLRHGIRTYIIMETNGDPKFDGMTVEGFAKYAEIIAQEFNSPSLIIIFGNEDDTPYSGWRTGKRIDLLVDRYVAVSKAIKRVNPAIGVATFGAGYWGSIWDGKFANFLKPFLIKVKEKGGPVDYVCWHVHDSYKGLFMMFMRAGWFREMLDSIGYKNVPLVLSEAGWQVVMNGTDEELAQYASVMVANMAALIEQGMSEDGLFFAAADFGNNTSTLSFRDKDGKIVGKESLKAFFFARQMLASRVRVLEGSSLDGRGLAKYGAYSADGKYIEFVFNTSESAIDYHVGPLVRYVDVYGREYPSKDGGWTIQPGKGYYVIGLVEKKPLLVGRKLKEFKAQ